MSFDGFNDNEIGTLIKGLDSEDIELVRMAAEALYNHVGKKPLPNKAVEALCMVLERGKKGAIPKVVDALDEQLTGKGVPLSDDAINSLFNALSNQDESLSNHAAIILSYHAYYTALPEYVVKGLYESLNQEDKATPNAANALNNQTKHKVLPKEAVKALCKALSYEDTEVRQASKWALTDQAEKEERDISSIRELFVDADNRRLNESEIKQIEEVMTREKPNTSATNQPPRKIAVISDIHANLEAFEAVVRDINENRIYEIYCLGDVVGYNCSPNEVILNLKLLGGRIKCITMGNHDYAISKKHLEILTSNRAHMAGEWSIDGNITQEYMELIGDLKLTYIGEEIKTLFVHSSPLEPERWWYVDYQLRERGGSERVFGSINPSLAYCFVGHSHKPFAYWINKGGLYGKSHEMGIDRNKPKGQQFIPDDKIKPDERVVLGEHEKAIINVGSVGQPRDENNKACYVIAEYVGDKLVAVTFRRVGYDFEKTQQTIKAAYKPWLENLSEKDKGRAEHYGSQVLPKLINRLESGK